MYLLGSGMGTMFANFHMFGIMLVVKSSFQHTSEKYESKRAMCYRCLMFSLSGPCELLFLLCLIVLLDLSCGACDFISLYFMCFSVNGSVCRVCCVFDSVCELFGETIRLGVVVILFLNAMDGFSLGGGALLDRPGMVFQIMCVLYL